MNILHVTSDFSFTGTGVTQVIRDLCEPLNEEEENSIEAVVYTTGNVFDPSENIANVKVVQHKAVQFQNSWCRWRSIQKDLYRCIQLYSIDIIHIHGLWEPVQAIAAMIASKNNLPSVVTEHGMLSEWSWNSQGMIKKWKKNIYWKIVAHKAFKNVSVFHLQNVIDEQFVKKLLPNIELLIIPNGIKIDMIKNHMPSGKDIKRECIFLFLGRIHPKKGIHLLVEAFANASIDEKWKVLIAGPDEDAAYLKELYDQVKHLGLNGRIDFIGSVHGQEKISLLSKCWVGVVPSFSEGSSLVPFEYAACAVPSIVTLGTGLIDWDDGGGILIETADTVSLTRALELVASWTYGQRLAHGALAMNFVEENYSISHIKHRWFKLYKKINRLNKNI